MEEERRNTKRRQFGYYMRVVNNSDSSLVGYLADICPGGFGLDSPSRLVVNKEYNLRLDLTPEVSERPFINFIACVKWSQTDVSDPGSYVEGFQITKISPHDEIIFNRILEKYGKPESNW
jgi:hypothetical protein